MYLNTLEQWQNAFEANGQQPLQDSF